MHLLSLVVDSVTVVNDTTSTLFSLGGILEILGIHCPLLQKYRVVGRVITRITDMQIETFTKGCPNLKDLYLNISSSVTFHKLLHSLGSYNSALEKLTLLGEEEDEE